MMVITRNNTNSGRQPVRSGAYGGGSSSTNSSRSLSAKSSSGKLSESSKQFVKEAYSNFYYPKWKLSTGKIVEDEMEKLAMKSDYEQYVFLLIYSIYEW